MFLWGLGFVSPTLQCTLRNQNYGI